MPYQYSGVAKTMPSAGRYFSRKSSRKHSSLALHYEIQRNFHDCVGVAAHDFDGNCEDHFEHLLLCPARCKELAQHIVRYLAALAHDVLSKDSQRFQLRIPERSICTQGGEVFIMNTRVTRELLVPGDSVGTVVFHIDRLIYHLLLNGRKRGLIK